MQNIFISIFNQYKNRATYVHICIYMYVYMDVCVHVCTNSLKPEGIFYT